MAAFVRGLTLSELSQSWHLLLTLDLGGKSENKLLCKIIQHTFGVYIFEFLWFQSERVSLPTSS